VKEEKEMCEQKKAKKERGGKCVHELGIVDVELLGDLRLERRTQVKYKIPTKRQKAAHQQRRVPQPRRQWRRLCWRWCWRCRIFISHLSFRALASFFISWDSEKILVRVCVCQEQALLLHGTVLVRR
jgi:hypothetical protein